MSATEQGFLVYPPYVLSAADRERWDISRSIAERQVELFEGHPDPRYVWMMTRSLYSSDVPTGTPADQEAARKQAAAYERSLGETPQTTVRPVIQEADASDPAEELWEQIKAGKPGPDASTDEFDAHTGRIADLFDLMYGNPDQYDFGEYELMDPSELGGLMEAFAGVHGPYNAALHPRSRGGKWAQKFNGLHQFALRSRTGVRTTLAAHLSAAAVRLGTMRAALPGGAYHHGQHSSEHLRAAHAAMRQGKAGPEHFAALASEERKRHGVSGAKRQAEKGKTVTLGTALTTIATIYSVKAEEKFGPLVEPAKSPDAAIELHDHAKDTAEGMHKLAEVVMEHRHEIGAVLKAGAHLAHGVARARGLAAADDRPDEDWVGDDAMILAELGESAEDVLVALGL